MTAFEQLLSAHQSTKHSESGEVHVLGLPADEKPKRQRKPKAAPVEAEHSEVDAPVEKPKRQRKPNAAAVAKAEPAEAEPVEQDSKPLRPHKSKDGSKKHSKKHHAVDHHCVDLAE